MTVKAQDLVRAAFIEMGAYSPSDTPGADEVAWGLEKASRMLDAWATKKSYVWAVNFLTFAMVPGLAPPTIGPADLVMPAWPITGIRPLKIEAANVVLNNANPPYVNQPMQPRTLRIGGLTNAYGAFTGTQFLRIIIIGSVPARLDVPVAGTRYAVRLPA